MLRCNISTFSLFGSRLARVIQSWQIFVRDLKRLCMSKRAWIVLVGILVIPALYSWINVRAFWDPYGETGNIEVGIVNEDLGATSEIAGSINVGEEVVAQLKDNDQLGWQFVDSSTAETRLNTGEYYASITIPRMFSQDIAAMAQGSTKRPTLYYRVNEKNSAVAPVITDTGASELNQKITAVFKQQVAQAVAAAIKDHGLEFTGDLTAAQRDFDTTFTQIYDDVGAARAQVATARDDLGLVRDDVLSAQDSIADVTRIMADAQTTLSSTQQLAEQAQALLADTADTAMASLIEGTTAVAEATGSARSSAATITADLKGAAQRFDTATDRVTVTINRTSDAIATLEQILDSSDISPELNASITAQLDALEARNASNRRFLENLQTLSKDNQNTLTLIDDLAQSADDATHATQTSAATLRSATNLAIPQINHAMSTLSSNAAAISTNLEAQNTTLSEASSLIGAISTQLGATQEAFDALDSDLASIQASIGGVRSDVQALGVAANSDLLTTVTGIDPARIGEFIGQPVQVKSTALYPINTYGSAMAALFTNLSLWIGAFALMVIFRVEVDTEGLGSVSVAQAYLGRFLLLAAPACGQAIVVTLGDMLIGVQYVNPLAFIGTGVLVGLAYLSIIYALTSAFGHVGRGLAVVLAILQIPGASGLYPIELMPDFFRALYPVLPLTYGINAMREVIGGFYGHHYATYIAVLVAMCVTSFGLGLLGRKGLAHFNLMFNRELSHTDLVRYESVQILGRGYRVADIMRALQGREVFAAQLARHTRNYLRWIRGIGIVGIAGMVVLGFVAWRFPQQKTLLLGVCALWIFLVIVAVVALEYLRQSLHQSRALAEMNDDELRAAIAARATGIHTDGASLPGGASDDDRQRFPNAGASADTEPSPGQRDLVPVAATDAGDK
ncbi:MAG: YhgE/Pip domain-containing protein [Actinomycetaceae bacterium]|nr:YhgE/Pip domain-containing protein [Actinomycetaceae bacterium]